MSINLRIVNSRPVSGFPVQFLSWVNVNISSIFFTWGKKFWMIFIQPPGLREICPRLPDEEWLVGPEQKSAFKDDPSLSLH